MGLETADTIDELNPLWPLGTDPKRQGDDHVRLLKTVLQEDAVSQARTDPQELAGDLGLALGAHLEFTGDGVDPEDAGHIRTTQNHFMDIDLADPGGTDGYNFRFGRNTDIGLAETLQTVFYRGDNTNSIGVAINHTADGGTEDDAAITVPLGVVETQDGAGGFRAVRGDTDGSSAQLLGNAILRDGNGTSSLMDLQLENGQNAGASDFEVRIGRTADAPNAAVAVYNPNTTTRRVQMGSAGGGFVKNTAMGFGVDIFGVANGSDDESLSLFANNTLRVRSDRGTTGAVAAFYGGSAGTTLSAAVQADSTLTPNTSQTLMTRSMHDARAVLRSEVRSRLEALTPAATVADLRAALLDALDAPVDMATIVPEA